MASYDVHCKCESASKRACADVTVTTDQGISADHEFCLRIDPAIGDTRFPDRGPLEPMPDVSPDTRPDTTPPPDDTGSIISPGNGQLQLQIADNVDPMAFGQPIVYSIVLQNDRGMSDRNVALSIVLPEGMRHIRTTGPVEIKNTSPDGRTIELTPLAEMRPHEAVSFRVETSAARAGTYTVRTKVQSLRQSEPLSVTETTTVNAP